MGTSLSTQITTWAKRLINVTRRAFDRANFELGRRYNNAEARRYDRRHGVQTSGKLSMAEMGFTGALAEHGTGFQSINESHLTRAFDSAPLPRDRGLVDVGSGRGKGLFVAYDAGFRPVVGVELVPDLCDTARRNIAVLDADIEVVEADALEYEFGAERVVLLNNPFDNVFLEVLVNRITANFSDGGGDGWILYGNPMHREVLDHHPAWSEYRHLHFWGPGRDIVIYRFAG